MFKCSVALCHVLQSMMGFWVVVKEKSHQLHKQTNYCLREHQTQIWSLVSGLHRGRKQWAVGNTNWNTSCVNSEQLNPALLPDHQLQELWGFQTSSVVVVQLENTLLNWKLHKMSESFAKLYLYDHCEVTVGAGTAGWKVHNERRAGP